MFRLFLHHLPQRMLAPYRGYFWIWHVMAAGITAVLVLTGFDWWFFRTMRSDALYPFIMLAGVGGFFVPVLLTVALYIWGERRKELASMRASVGVAQASIIAWVVVAIYKVFTGRIQPEFLTTFGTDDISRSFQFGFFEHGIFWGWPSHHTAVAVAGATILYLAYRHSALRLGALVWAAVVAMGASVGFHWFSDVVAGVVVGIVVGVTVWRAVAEEVPLKK